LDLGNGDLKPDVDVEVEVDEDLGLADDGIDRP